MTSFHVRHDFTPAVAREALLLLRVLPGSSTEMLLAQARARDLELGRRRSLDKVVASLRDLGLIGRRPADGNDGLWLTAMGRDLATVAARDALLFAEYVHMRYCCLWHVDDRKPPFAWAYRTMTGILWEEAPCRIDGDRLVGMVIAAARDQLDAHEVSFSTSSVLGVLHWLRALRPPCLSGVTFRRRPACPPEAVLLALEGVVAGRGCDAAMAIPLDGETRAAACRLVLADDAAFDEALEQAEESLGLVRRHGDGGDTVLVRSSVCPGLVSQCRQP